MKVLDTSTPIPRATREADESTLFKMLRQCESATVAQIEAATGIPCVTKTISEGRRHYGLKIRTDFVWVLAKCGTKKRRVATYVLLDKNTPPSRNPGQEELDLRERQ